MRIEELVKNFESMEDVYITDIAEIKDGVFKDFKYFTIEHNGYYYYIEEKSEFWRGISITAYKKIDFNTRCQIRFPIENIENLDQCLNYMLETEILKLTNLFGNKQRISFDFVKSKKPEEKEYKTIFEKIDLGYREKDILKNIDHVELIQNDGTYKVYKICDFKNNYFEIEVNSKRIVG